MEDQIGSQDSNPSSSSSSSSCFGAGSVAGAVIGTFLTTIVLSAVAVVFYKQWRRHKGKHLVLVTDPEIVEDAYAFDNPCFKDATPTDRRISTDRPITIIPDTTPAKDSTRWSTPWTSLGIGSTNRNDKRRTLDDSCLGPKATRVCVVSLRSRDFTGLGFNVCGNMREGIFVKDLLHRGPASESGRIHPGDRIASVKISFRNMVYEDALTILSYASPYDVELEVESGGTGSKPATLLKKTVGPSPTRICHPLYRSQSIPELSQAHKSSAKRLFIADPNESVGSNYSTMNSTLKSSKSTPGSHTLERRHDEAKNNHHKFGIKVLPALDGTVHRIENQNEHNTNLERRHSKKMDVEKHMSNSSATVNVIEGTSENLNKVRTTEPQKSDNLPNFLKSTKRRSLEINGIDVIDNSDKSMNESITIPSEVPAEVHNAAMAARRNRKNSAELLNSPKIVSQDLNDMDDPKSPPKNKRKAPAPPKTCSNNEPDVVTPVKKIITPSRSPQDLEKEDAIDSIADYTESLNDYVNKVKDDTTDDATDETEIRRPRIESHIVHRRNSESDTDSEVQNSFTTIELNSADITIHRTPVPEVNDDEDDDVYRKAASLGDLSKYESKTSTPLERAQSLDMTDTGLKKRKAPLPPEDINESTEDLTKLDQMDTFDKCKLKKSNEWGTLEDVLWTKEDEDDKSKKPRTRKKSNSTLERSKSSVEIKLKDEVLTPVANNDRLDDIEVDDNETSIELYNLPLSKRLTQEFIHTERMFNPDEDNSLARIVNDGKVVKSPTMEEIELDFRQAKPLPNEDDEDDAIAITEENDYGSPVNEDFSRALRYFEMHASKSPTNSNESTKVNLTRLDEWREESLRLSNDPTLYVGKKVVVEEPMTKIFVDKKCRGCEEKSEQHENNCKRQSLESVQDNKRYRNNDYQEHSRQSTPENKSFESVYSSNVKDINVGARSSTPTYSKVNYSKLDTEISKTQDQLKSNNELDLEHRENSLSTFHANRSKFEEKSDQRGRYSPIKSKSPTELLLESNFTKRNLGLSNNKELERENDDHDDHDDEEIEEEDEYEFGSNVTVNSKNLSPNNDRHNISNISVSSGENSEDSGLVRESIDYNSQESETRPPLPSTPMPNNSQKMTYITEIKVSANRDNIRGDHDNITEDVQAVTGNNGEARKLTHHEITVTSNGKPNSGKKPPVPPRRSDITKMVKDDKTEKNVVYVSEYKSMTGKDAQISDTNLTDDKLSESNKKFEHWIFLGDNKDQNRWGNGSSQPQSVTNIMLSSGDDKMLNQ